MTETRIEVIEGDITHLAVDAAAGPELLAACRRIGGCPTGEARLTPGYRLPARYVIHTVGPVWRGGDTGEDELLARCYRSSLALAAAHRVATIAFPAIATGVYGFPRPRACAIAVAEIRSFLAADETLQRVSFVCFDRETSLLYRRELGSG